MLSDIEGMGPGWCMGEAPLVARRGFRCGGVAYGCTMRVSEGYTDKPLTKACDFSLPVRSDLTLYAKREAKPQSYAILYKDGLLSLQAGPDTDPSRGEVLGKWAWDGSSRPWYDAEGKQYDRLPAGVAGTFSRAKPAVQAAMVDDAPAQDAGVVVPAEPSTPEQSLSLACTLQTARNVFIPMNKDKEMLSFL